MATVHLDTLTDLECREERGAIVGLRRSVLVTDMATPDYETVMESLDEANVPDYGSSPTNYPNLILVARNARLVPDHTDHFTIELEYIAKSEDNANFRFRGSTQLTQYQTTRDYYGQDIFTSHTFPVDDGDIEYAGLTKVQGGEISVMLPRTTLQATGIMNAEYPWFVSHFWTGRINAKRWADGPAYCWQCTDVSWKYHDMGSTPKKAEFSFEFVYDAHGHFPVIWYKDPRTGLPPYGLVAGVGWKYVTWYPAADFNRLFPM